MHGSIQLIVASESDRLRHAEADRVRSRTIRGRSVTTRVLERLRPGRAPAPGLPSRAAPGKDSRSLGHPGTAAARPLSGR